MNTNNPISVRMSKKMQLEMKKTIQNKKSLLMIKDSNDNKLYIHNLINIAFMYHACDHLETKKRKKELKKIQKKLIKDSKDNRKSKDKIRISVRLSAEEILALKNMYGEYANTISDFIKLAILDVIYNPIDELKEYYSTRYLLGMKNKKMCQWINPVIMQFANNGMHRKYVETFAGTANMALHQAYKGFVSMVLSDNNTLGINLLNVIKKYPKELILRTRLFHVNKRTFKYLKSIIKNFNPAQLHGKDSCIYYAAVYYYLCNLSCYGQGEYLKSDATDNTLYNKLKQIPQISMQFRLNKMEFKHCDALKRLDNIIHKKESDNIIYLDPPYIGTEEIYKKQNEDKKVFFGHRKLCNRMDKLSKLGNIVLLSYRVTASETVRQEAIEKNQENPDKLMRRTIDKLYLGKNYHIAFKLINIEKRQIEILISNKEFTDGDGKHSILYNQPLEYMDIENIVGLVNIEEDMANIA